MPPVLASSILAKVSIFRSVLVAIMIGRSCLTDLAKCAPILRWAFRIFPQPIGLLSNNSAVLVETKMFPECSFCLAPEKTCQFEGIKGKIVFCEHRFPDSSAKQSLGPLGIFLLLVGPSSYDAEIGEESGEHIIVDKVP
jgi:hypothetical protein